MKNTFTVSIKEDGTWQRIKATPVFPFSWGELLDERLDEAYITLYDSRTKNYPRLTEFKVTIINNAKVKEEYFILASDNSHELPVGSGKYKHEIYLIERTKLLEGQLCSSLTFTNTRGNMYTDYSVARITDNPNVEGVYSTLSGYDLLKVVNPLLKSPISVGSSIPTAKEIGDIIAEHLVESNYFTSAVCVESQFLPGKENNNSTHIEVNGYPYNWNHHVVFDTPQMTTIGYEIAISVLTLSGNREEIGFYFIAYMAAVQNRLPLKRWSITDCITRCCELAEPLFGSEKPKYRLDGVEYDGNGDVIKPYPVGSLAEKYDKVFAPEFTLTEDTLREQLKVIFSYVHAEPWLDENDVIQATEYGGTLKSPSASLPYVYNAVSSHINEYCTEVRSHAQNLASSLGYAKGVMIDPGKGLYRSLRTDIAYSRITESNGIARTEKPIYEITQVMCGIASYRDLQNGYMLAPVDITPYVFEATEYGANLSSYKGGYPYSKAYAIYYTQGQHNLNGLFYRAPDNISTANFSKFAISNILSAVSGVSVDTIDRWLVEAASRLVFSITYKPISNHFVSHGKSLYVAGETPYMQLYNQSENLVESQYYGEHLKGVAARLGNVEKERTFILKDIDNVPKVGQLLDGYAISAVSCELYPFDIKCTVGLSKDFNRISQYVGINSQKRMYEVSERQATQRDILIRETLVIGTKPTTTPANTIFGVTPFYRIFEPNDADYRISAAAFFGFNKAKGLVEDPVTVPVISRALGNMLTFNFTMKDNYSAGNGTQYIDGSEDGITGRWETDVPYTDYYGRIWWASCRLYYGDRSMSEEAQQVDFAFNTPSGALADTQILRIDDHRLRKDNREVIAYNIELEIKTDNPDIIVGSALASLCGYVNDTPSAAPVLYYLPEGISVGKFDQQYTPREGDTAYPHGDDASKYAWDITVYNGTYVTVRPTSGRGWVICTPIETVTDNVEDDEGFEMEVSYQKGGEILLASNAPVDGEPLKLDFYVVKN